LNVSTAGFTHLGRISSKNMALKSKKVWHSTIKNCGILESFNEGCDCAIKMWAYKKDESNLEKPLFVPIFFI